MIFAFFHLLAGCANPGSSVGSTQPSLLAAEEIGSIELQAVIPTDVVARPDGGFLVLDGYAGKLWSVAADGKSPAAAIATGRRGLGAPIATGRRAGPAAAR